MKNLLIATNFLLIGLALGQAGMAQAQNHTGNLNLSLGAKTLNEDDWSTNDDQFEIGLEADFKQAELPFYWTMGLTGSGADNTFINYDSGYLTSIKDEVTTTELRLGLKLIWEPFAGLHGFLGGGPALIAVNEEFSYSDGYTHVYTYGYRDYYYVDEYEGLQVSDDGIACGAWATTGLYWTFDSGFNLGFSIGYSTGRARLFGDKVDVGGGHFGLISGFHF